MNARGHTLPGLCQLLTAGPQTLLWPRAAASLCGGTGGVGRGHSGEGLASSLSLLPEG